MKYEGAAKVFKALAHPFRLRLLRLLCADGGYVCHLVEVTGRQQSYVSQHLHVLRSAGLVIDRKEGLYVSYQIRDPALVGVLDLAAAIASGPTIIRVSPDIWLPDACPACRARRRRSSRKKQVNVNGNRLWFESRRPDFRSLRDFGSLIHGGPTMWKQLAQPTDAVRYFHPGWFASVMGTGILAVATAHSAPFVPALKELAAALWVFNTILCLVLLVPWVARWLLFFDEAWADVSHPTRGPFYSTLPIGLLVLGVDFSSIGRQYIGAGLAIPVAQGLWIAGALLAFFFGVLIPYQWFTHHSIPVEQTNGGWFMPPVANIVVPASAAPLIATWGSPELCYFMCLVAFAFLGIGFFLFLIVGVLLIGRLIYHPLPHAHLAPTLWIGLGPIGVGSLALVRLSTTASPIFGEHVAEAQVFLRLASISLWGFGVWWLATAIVLTLRYLREPFPFAMSWWAFTFPLGAYTVATYLLADAYQTAALGVFGFALWLLLLFFWTVVLVRTAAGTYTGALLQAPVPAPAAR